MAHLRQALALAAILVLAFCANPSRAQLPQDQAASLLLNSARKAYNEKNYPFAVAKFKEYVGKFGNLPDATAARYGLALGLIEGTEKNYNEARDVLQAVVGNKQFADHAYALYYLGVAIRGQGLNELQQAEGKNPQEAQNRRNIAQQRFTEAATFFTSALPALLALAKEDKKEAKEPSPELEWTARCRCDLAEMQLRLSKAKEAQATAESFTKDQGPPSRYRNLGRYYYGYASLLLKDNARAQKTLSMLAPFQDAIFGNHARYLLARTYHVAEERAEAQAQYEAVLTDYAASKTEALKRLQQPQVFNNDPVMRAQLETVAKGPVPEYLQRASLYLGVLLYEGGKFAEAQTRLQEFLKQFPQSPLRTEAELRIGFCQVQMKTYPDALKTLTPLIDRDPKLSDQVLLWIAKAQAGSAPEPSANAAGHQQAINMAINTLRQAAERAQRVQNEDAEAKTRRGEIMIELADQMQHIKQHKESANLYNQLLSEKVVPEREEEIVQRLAAALHLAGDFNESDKVGQRFQEKYPQSTLLPAVLFTSAENSYFRMLAAEKNPNVVEKTKEAPRNFEDAVKRFQAIIEKYPEYPKINVARYSLGLTYYRHGNLDKAQQAFSSVPGPERGGELAVVPFLIADCILRQTPSTVPEDALAAGKLEEQLKTSAELLEGFVAANPKDAQTADAILKYGLCQQRLAGLLSQPPEKQKTLAAARAAYERLMSPEFAKQPQAVQAVLERAKCMMQTGDVNGATNELRRFLNDPLKQNSQVAPMALIQLGTLLRAQNKAPEAADILNKAREQHEPNLAKDPERGSWVGLLRYHQGIALREAGKLPEARAQFETVVKTGNNRPEAIEAALRVGQCLKDEGQLRIDTSIKLRGSAKKEDQAKAQQLRDEGYKIVRDSVGYLESQAEQLKKQEGRQDIAGRMLYEAAWATRILAEPELETARSAVAAEMVKKIGASNFSVPDVALDKVPMQPAEKKARGLYKSLVDTFPDAAIATEARFELAEMLAQRGEFDEAVKLLTEVLDKEPSQELTEKIRLRLGGIHASKGNVKAALGQFDAVAQNPKSALVGWAQYRAGEALLQNQHYDEAIKRLAAFRDNGQYQNLPGLSDRALLRLGYAYALTKAWDPSRQAYERLVGAFPNSPWADEGRYGMGWALQQQKNFDGAVNVYTQVVGRTVSETAAKAQLQIGLCRLEQKRFQEAANALLVVPFTYNYPELRAAARLEAAQAFIELRQNDQALKQLQTIQQEFAGTPWAEAAKERLESLKK